jgi:hypothetical protein
LKDAAQRLQDAASDGFTVPQLLQVRCAAGAIFSSFLAIIFIYLKYSRFASDEKMYLDDIYANQKTPPGRAKRVRALLLLE